MNKASRLLRELDAEPTGKDILTVFSKVENILKKYNISIKNIEFDINVGTDLSIDWDEKDPHIKDFNKELHKIPGVHPSLPSIHIEGQASFSGFLEALKALIKG